MPAEVKRFSNSTVGVAAASTRTGRRGPQSEAVAKPVRLPRGTPSSLLSSVFTCRRMSSRISVRRALSRAVSAAKTATWPASSFSTATRSP